MSANSEETIPQIALFIQESSVRPPPPPPHQAAPSSVPRTISRAVRPMSLPMQHLLPPPPPPPPVVPSPSTSQFQNPVYHAQSPRPTTSFAISHPPPIVPVFDARRPPPNLPNLLNSNCLKRTLSNSCTAGAPCKLRRMEGPQSGEGLCDLCVQREISIENCKKKMENIRTEDECQSLLFKKKLNEYQKQKTILRSLLGSELFRKVEEFVEDVPQYNFRNVLNNLNDSVMTGLTSSIPNQLLLQCMDLILAHSTKFESTPSARAEDSLRQTLSTMSRAPSISRSSTDLQTLQDILYNEDRPSSSDRPGPSGLCLERLRNPGANAVSNLSRYSNGQRLEPRTAPPPVSLPPPAPLALPPAPSAPPAPTPPANYPHYPPQRSYYPNPYHAEPRPSTSRAPVEPYPPYSGERHPHPYYYYH